MSNYVTTLDTFFDEAGPCKLYQVSLEKQVFTGTRFDLPSEVVDFIDEFAEEKPVACISPVVSSRKASKAKPQDSYGSVSPLGKGLPDYKGRAPFRSASDFDGGALRDKTRRYNKKLYFCPHCNRGYQGQDARLLAHTCCIDHTTITVQYNVTRDKTLHQVAISRHWTVDGIEGVIRDEHGHIKYVLHDVVQLDNNQTCPIWTKSSK